MKMKMKTANWFFVIFIGAAWFTLALFSWFTPPQKISISERRTLVQFPRITTKRVIEADFVGDFEQYAKDQFPYRFLFRTAKAYVRFYPLGQKDNNGIYIKDGYAVKLEYPLNEKSIQHAANKFRYIYEKYMQDKKVKVYLTVIPDKGYFLSKANGYPSMDYGKLFEMIEAATGFASYINISDILEINDYYKTDIHWRQEKLMKVADKIKSVLGAKGAGKEGAEGAEAEAEAEGAKAGKESVGEYAVTEADIPFYGVYYGHSALPMKAEKLIYLTSDSIEECTVYNQETGAITAIYDLEKLSGYDPYDVYLSGAAALLVINNPNAKTAKELVIFRDSFGSSLAPLLIGEYSKVTMIDIRYIASDLIGHYVTFDNQDVLFAYSTSILNLSTMLK